MKKTTMTSRILDARAETARKLEKELGYGDLQHTDRVEFYREHIAHLDNMLANLDEYHNRLMTGTLLKS